MQLFFNNENDYLNFGENNDSFEFPTNIKQIGAVDHDFRIYMEDYVYTYLYQYSAALGNKEKLAVLVGKHLIVDEKEIVIISGAIQGKHTTLEKGIETFTKESWDYINKEIETFFTGLSVVGWMHTQPSFGTFLTARDDIFHKEYFDCQWHVLYLQDPVEKTDSFYVYDDEKNKLRNSLGYFIYYSKNENMREYMIQNNLYRNNKKEDVHIKLMGENENDNDVTPKIRNAIKKKQDEFAKEELDMQFKNKDKQSLIPTVSAMLCFACIMMGTGLLQNQDKIRTLELEISNIKNGYDIVSNKLSLDETQQVFAPINDDLVEVSVVPVDKVVDNVYNDVSNIAETDKTGLNTAANSQEIVDNIVVTEGNNVDKINTVIAGTNINENEIIKQEESLAFEYYVIEAGDSLSVVSQKFYGDNSRVSDIMVANNLDNSDKIFVGQKIVLPK